jgi:hypothetical protein
MAALVPDINDKEFYDDIRRGLIIVIGAVLRKYRLTWIDFLPREENAYIRRLAQGQPGMAYRDSAMTEPKDYSPSVPVADP